jgi:hypothetical protein
VVLFDGFPTRDGELSGEGAAPATAGGSVVEPDVPRCQFIRADGSTCGSPSLKNRRLCYFHSQTADGRKEKGAPSQPPSFHLPVLEDDRAIQMAVTNVCRSLVEETLDSRRAATLLYGLKVASSALRSRPAPASNDEDHNMC